MGQSPPGTAYNVDGNGLPFFQGKAEFGDIYPIVKKWTTESAKVAKQGDILLSVRAPVGPTNLAPSQCAIGRGLASIRARSGISQRYLLHALRATTSALAAKATGSTFTAVSGAIVRAHKIPLPPLTEQHRIVEALEEHLTRLAAAEHLLTTAQIRSKSLKRSAIERAMNGGLTAQSNKEEAVEILLKRIEGDLLHTETRKRRKSTVSPGLSRHTNPPRHWTVQPLGALTRKIEYGTSAKAHVDPSDTDVPVLRMGNIQDGRLDMTKLKYLPGEHPDTAKLLLSDGDLLFNRTNSAELVGKAAVYQARLGPATFASYLIRCQLADGVEPEWVSTCINSPEGRRYINSVAAQQVGQANVNGAKLAAFPIPLPPHGEQLRLLAKLREWHDTVDRTTSTTKSALGRSKHLRQAILRRAFTGHLVPQDPADEPASVLLDRIRVEREAEMRNSKGKAKRAPRRPRKTATADAPPPPPASATSIPAQTHAVQQELPL